MTAAISISALVAMVTITTALIGIVVWAIRLEGRMNLHEDRHRTLAGIVDGIKDDFASGIKEIRGDNKEFRVEIQRIVSESRREIHADLLYIKGRLEKLLIAQGSSPKLRRENEDDRLNND